MKKKVAIDITEHPETDCVIGYVRVSTKSQKESGLGEEAQREYIQTAANAAGWNVIEIITEEAVSGSTKPEDRPGMQRAIALANEHGAAILAAKVDRISRSVKHFAHFIDDHHVRIATLPGADTFQLQLFALLAEKERRFIRERTRAALAALAERAANGEPEAMEKVQRRAASITRNRTRAGQLAGAHTQREAAADFADTIRAHLLEAMHDNGGQPMSFAQYAAALNKKKITTRTGASWNPATIRRAMQRMKPL
ncbi:resolvase-like protein [Buttiauxella sp. BIGb0552]|uniref:recombinase family protein n=1 Tax=Buttiauxella sp. BIGb0552 TaxID=2485120 RepID=UPI001064F819|nr:recombinase family protein [Buttiauxella sp. BIGb0552]TDX09601.1 resolvase-like protein [Buttiauxella sp. BIGb0552]